MLQYHRDREVVDDAAASAELVFRIRTPDRCAATRFRPINFIYENADVKSMPTAEVVWWKDAD